MATSPSCRRGRRCSAGDALGQRAEWHAYVAADVVRAARAVDASGQRVDGRHTRPQVQVQCTPLLFPSPLQST